MKHVLTVLLAAVCISLQAKPFEPILFDDPSFDIRSTELTPEQRSFFDQYAHAMERIAAGAQAENYFFIERAEMEDGVVVEPLLGDINFNQGTPYNNKCPISRGQHAVTGCVATAMAQVMRYWKYPACGTGQVTYSGGSSGAKTIDLATMPFDWNHILPTYDGVSYTQTEADAVATLMLACGAALTMNYDVDGSSASTSKVNGLLKNNFFYDRSVGFISTLNSSNPDETLGYWGEDVVRPDLEAGRPLIFAGFPSSTESGHCFVLDGYKVENGIYYYHINWGWGGHGNSWCLLTRMQDGEGTNYSGHNVQMVYNIFPKSQDIESVESDDEVHATKIMHDGQILIERNNSTYTMQGQRIK